MTSAASVKTEPKNKIIPIPKAMPPNTWTIVQTPSPRWLLNPRRCSKVRRGAPHVGQLFAGMYGLAFAMSQRYSPQIKNQAKKKGPFPGPGRKASLGSMTDPRKIWHTMGCRGSLLVSAIIYRIPPVRSSMNTWKHGCLCFNGTCAWMQVRISSQGCEGTWCFWIYDSE